MEKAIAEISVLSEHEQDALAVWLLAEQAAECKWGELFAESEDLLSELADEALEEHHSGKTLPLDPDTL